MSTSVHLYPRALEKKFQAAKDPSFLEEKANLIPFSAEVLKELVEALELRGFDEGKKNKFGRTFQNELWGAEALVTETGVFLSASGEGVFEILMFGDEIASKEIAKFDPQEGSWA
jgi:hypothetical protein